MPPGTSKWNKIEHRLFSFISQNWRGRPLVSYAVILSLIAATTNTSGLTVESYLDTATYPVGRKVSAEEMASLRLERAAFHGEWNYTPLPPAFVFFFFFTDHKGGQVENYLIDKNYKINKPPILCGLCRVTLPRRAILKQL